MWPRMTCMAVWLAVAAMVCDLAWGSSGCNNKDACSSCIQTQNCMWCDRSGNFTGEEGMSLSRCMQYTDNVPSKWREACGAGNIHEPAYVSEDSRSEKCNFHGTYQCGECQCDDGYLGKQCECHSSTLLSYSGSFDDSSCRETNTSAICSSRGTCSCGECMCFERDNLYEIVSGAFCECTNFLCPYFNGQICGGPDHGDCVCNKCVCKPGWIGDDCMCEDSRDNCMNPETGKECSGQGVCQCNKCQCFDTDAGHFQGKHCEDCPTCKLNCVAYKPCVQCQVFQTGEFTPEECVAHCTQFNSTIVHVVEAKKEERMCSFFDENDCRFTFVYGYTDNNVPVVRVQRTLYCPPGQDIQRQTPHLPASNKQSTAGEKSQGSLPYPTYSISVLVSFMFVILLIGYV